MKSERLSCNMAFQPRIDLGGKNNMPKSGIILIALLAVSFFGCGGSLANFDDVPFQEVYTVDSSSSDEIFTRANLWVAETYNSPKDVIKYSDSKTGIIIGNGAFPYPRPRDVSDCVLYDFKIESKDGRVRYTVSNLRRSFASAAGGTVDTKIWSSDSLSVIQYFENTGYSLNQQLRAKTMNRNSNW